jgi:cytoskeletal protein CcmA (bactofilin family)
MSNRTRHRQGAVQSPGTGTAWTVLGPGSLVQGDLILSGDVIIHGRVEGAVFTDGEVRIAALGSVEGGVHAPRVVVEGTCRGRVEGTEEVMLRAGSVVHADVEAAVLTIDEGARFFGVHRLGDPPAGPRVLPYENRDPGHA